MAEYPRIAVGGAANHQSIHTKCILIILCRRSIHHVTVADNGDVHAGIVFHSSDEGPIGGIAVFGGAQAAVDGQGGDAHVLQAFGDVDDFAVRVIVTEACLDRHRCLYRLHHSFSDGHHLRDVVHDARAGTFRSHLLYRTTEVDVDDIRVGRLGITRRLHHRIDGVAEDLNAHGTFHLLKIEFLDAFHRVADKAVGGDEFRVHHVGAKEFADITERRVRHVFHRREEQRIMLEFEVGEFVHFLVSALRPFDELRAQDLGFYAAKVQKVYLCSKINLIMNDNLKQSTGIRILIFLVILLISGLIGVAASALFMFAGDTGMKLGQGISSIFMFVVPPIVYYFITRKEHQMRDLGLRKLSPPWWLILIGAILMFISLPVSNLLTEWNEGMKLGGAFQMLEDMMKTLEQTATDLTERMLNVDTIGGLLLNLIIIALIPAVGEELTFRGVIQQGLTRRMNPHVAIILSAAIFSFIHFQFYGFLTRMFLGMLLGYMFYITGSLWTSILMHFLNNGSAVLIYYLNNKGIINVDVDHFGATQSVWLIIVSAVVTIGLIAWSWIKAQPKKQAETTPLTPPAGNN